VSGPISASPDSLTTTRLNNGRGAFDMPSPSLRCAPPHDRRPPVLCDKKSGQEAA
jgi:hypothetical protein